MGMSPYTAAQRKQVRQMLAAGHTVRRIADQTGVSDRTIRRWGEGRIKPHSVKGLEQHTEQLRAAATEKADRIEQALQRHGAMPNSLIRQHVSGMSRDTCNRYLIRLEHEGRVQRLDGPHGARWRSTHGQALDRFIYRRAA